MSMNVVYTEAFETWIKGLRDQRAKFTILSRIERTKTAILATIDPSGVV